MSASRLKRQLREAKKAWKSENKNADIQGMSGYMSGVLKGFEETLRIVEEYHRQEVMKSMADRQMHSRSNAVTLYRACQHAYSRLKYSDRAGAIRALQRALEEIKS